MECMDTLAVASLLTLWLAIALLTGLLIGRVVRCREQAPAPSASQRRHEGLRLVV
jgi:hypothetical protein